LIGLDFEGQKPAFYSEDAPVWLDLFNKKIAKVETASSGPIYSAGTPFITYADILLLDVLDILELNAPVNAFSLKEFPQVQRWRGFMQSNERLQAYFKSERRIPA
jgi:hypothetical protein